jgi:Transposase
VFAGIDTHKDTLAVAVVDQVGLPIVRVEEPNTRSGFVRIGELLATHQVTRVGIEGSGSFGRCVAPYLVLDWDQPGVAVLEVPTVMTSRERGARPGKGKTDPVDAVAIARITMRESDLPPVRLAVGDAADLRALLDYREDLVSERSDLVNRVHADLAGLFPGYHHQIPNLIYKGASGRRPAAASRRHPGPCRADPASAGPGARHRPRNRRLEAAHRRLRCGQRQHPGQHLRHRADHRRSVPGRDRRHQPLPESERVRLGQRHGTLGCVVGTDPPQPLQPRREPPPEQVPLHDRDHPGPRRHRRPGPLPTQTPSRQDQQRSPPLPHWMSIGMRATVVCSSGTTRDGLAVLPLDGLFELVALVVAGTRDRHERAAL